MNLKQEILEKKIVFLSPDDPFTWASGIKSPIYCDMRLILAYPKLRDFVAQELANLVIKKYPEVEVVMGTATAGIPHATLISQKTNLPCGYVRSSGKKHGRCNQIEGAQVKNKKVVVIEDLISTGMSVLEAVEALKEAGAQVVGVIGIMTYNLQKAKDEFDKKNLEYFTITNIDEILSFANDKKFLNKNQTKQVNDFLNSL